MAAYSISKYAASNHSAKTTRRPDAILREERPPACPPLGRLISIATAL
jgi:hypothetical protein